MDLNYVRRFSAYVSTFYHSEYITQLSKEVNNFRMKFSFIFIQLNVTLLK